MKYLYTLAIMSIFLTSMISCKKDAPFPVTIIGKWYITKQQSQLFYKGILLDSYIDTSFTTNDFVDYFVDGSGYFSQNTATSPGISEFTYTVNGNILTQIVSGGTATPETITLLTTNNLSIQANSLVPDPNNSGQLDNELDNYNYTKAK